MAKSKAARTRAFAVTTWNINSVRLRIGNVERLLQDQQPDVLCLQEIKCMDELFPAAALHALGYVHQHVHGQKSYNGVAIISKHPFAATAIKHWAGREDRRHISVRLADMRFGGLEIHNLYVPAGGDLPDPERNVKFRHKLDFVEALTSWSAALPSDRPRILVGDLNIAPEEHDVWNSRKLRDIVSHTEVERTLMRRWLAAGKWIDTARHFHAPDEKLYSWWSYRSPNWQTRDLGRRLDHIWASPDLQPHLRSIDHHRDARAWTQPSDHVPVTLQLNPILTTEK